jgi:hypothetical protein
MRCDNVRSVYELPKDFGVFCDNDEVRELSINDLQVQHVRTSPTRCNVSYVPGLHNATRLQSSLLSIA